MPYGLLRILGAAGWKTASTRKLCYIRLPSIAKQVRCSSHVIHCQSDHSGGLEEWLHELTWLTSDHTLRQSCLVRLQTYVIHWLGDFKEKRDGLFTSSVLLDTNIHGDTTRRCI